MVAYNFQARFVEAIRTGKKTHTIRQKGKRAHAQPGQMVQLYTGMRTKKCKKIVPTDPQCVRTAEMIIRVDNWIAVNIDGKWLNPDEIDRFAISDGFSGAETLHAWGH